jgi:hypothetical protein
VGKPKGEPKKTVQRDEYEEGVGAVLSYLLLEGESLRRPEEDLEKYNVHCMKKPDYLIIGPGTVTPVEVKCSDKQRLLADAKAQICLENTWKILGLYVVEGILEGGKYSVLPGLIVTPYSLSGDCAYLQVTKEEAAAFSATPPRDRC